MSAKEQVERLELLLARVKARAAEPRPAARVFTAPAAAFAAPEPAASRYTDDVAARAPLTAPPTAPPPDELQEVDELQQVDGDSIPPETVASSPPEEVRAGWSSPPPTTNASTPPEMYDDVDVEVSAEVVEVDIDVDDVPRHAESGVEPVAEVARSVPPVELDAIGPSLGDELEEVDGGARLTEPHEPSVDSEPTFQAAAGEATAIEAPVLPANEIEEPAPSSSRRPIAPSTAPNYDDVSAYAEESSPRHTPPPESGKQVAAPSVAPPRRAPSTVPPPSVEGHTLIGGWREPGLPRGAPPASLGLEAPTSPPGFDVAEAATRVAPEVTRGVLPATMKAHTIQGVAPMFVPKSFGELLDASLDL